MLSHIKYFTPSASKPSMIFLSGFLSTITIRRLPLALDNPPMIMVEFVFGCPYMWLKANGQSLAKISSNMVPCRFDQRIVFGENRVIMESLIAFGEGNFTQVHVQKQHTQPSNTNIRMHVEAQTFIVPEMIRNPNGFPCKTGLMPFEYPVSGEAVGGGCR